MGLPYLLILSQNTLLIGRASLPLSRIVPSLIRNYCCHHFYDVVGKCRQKKSIQKFAPSAKKKPTKAVAAAEQVDAATAVPNTYKHIHTGMNCCCDGVSVNKKPIKRARNTLLLLLFQQESQPTSSSNNGKPTNQTGRAEQSPQPTPTSSSSSSSKGSASSCVVVFAATVLFSNTLPETHHHAALSQRRQRQRQQQQFQYEKFFNVHRRRVAARRHKCC